MRQIDTLKVVLEMIQALKAELPYALSADGYDTQQSIEIKARLCTLKDHVCDEMAKSILRQERKQAAKSKQLKVA
jgi:hypothetical protein